MIKALTFLLIILLPALLSAQGYKSHQLQKNRLSIQLSEGVLNIIPLSDKAVRIIWEKDSLKEDRELVFVDKKPVPAFRVTEAGSQLKLSTNALTVWYNKTTGAIQYSNLAGKVFLREKAGSRKLVADTILNQPCFVAEQSFDSPVGEYLFGLGQFQDGQYNLRNVPRKLVQVNTQIAIPFLYSSRGFGILWHQYGLTQFNPADNIINLLKADGVVGDKKETEVTTTNGTQRISQQQSLYTGSFTVAEDGPYSVMLDLGDMESRHLLIIDDKPCIDQSNLWLPPAVGKLVDLKAGKHTVQVVCKASNTPRLSWSKATDKTTFRSPNARSLDYVVFYGKNADGVIADYRNLSGTVPMLPLWAYGYWQCRERYTSADQLVQAVEGFRKRNLPMDVIVQDWQYWGKNGWGVPKFDSTNYPNPSQFIQKLHDLHSRISVSVWENPDKKSDVVKEYVDKNLFIPNSPWIDIFKPETRQTHWNTLNKNLFAHGLDSWWMDATEPENDALAGKQTQYGLGDFYRLTYPLFVSKAVYEGQRKTDTQKRVAILTRSAFAGQQRYGTINWSGDIGWSWDAFKRQIVAGANYSLTGMPFWTTDIGGFFRPGRSQYTDTSYHEILTRWFQWGAFNTIFRMHGYQTETEPWKYGDAVMANMRIMLNLRYRLLPYIYSEAWKISSKGSTMMRPLVMDFQDDTTAVNQAYQYMFGQSLLVAPVTEPGIRNWSVYLPKATAWYNFWTGQRFAGGQVVNAPAPPDNIPVFVKAGAIVPFGKPQQYTAEKAMDTLEIRVYTGASGQFDLYSDEGDNYNYEKGKHQSVLFDWNDTKQTLTINKLQGDYQGALKKYTFHIVWVNEQTGYGIGAAPKATMVAYTGEKLVVKKQ